MAAEIDQQLLQLAKYLEAERTRAEAKASEYDMVGDDNYYYRGAASAYSEAEQKVRKILMAHAAINRRFARHIEEHLMSGPREVVRESER